jgi:hypothetical protein
LGENPVKSPKLKLVLEEIDLQLGWETVMQKATDLCNICEKNYNEQLLGSDTTIFC